MWDNIINIKLSTNQIITKFESKTPSTNIPFHQGVFFLRIHTAVFVELEQAVWLLHVLEAPDGRVVGRWMQVTATTQELIWMSVM